MADACENCVVGGYLTHPPWLSLWAKCWDILVLDLSLWLVSSEWAVTSLNGLLCRNSCFAGSTFCLRHRCPKICTIYAMLVAPTKENENTLYYHLCSLSTSILCSCIAVTSCMTGGLSHSGCHIFLISNLLMWEAEVEISCTTKETNDSCYTP